MTDNYSSDKKLNNTIQILMAVLVITSITMTIFESIESLMKPEYRNIFLSVHLSILSVFLAEFLYRLWCTGQGFTGKLKWKKIGKYLLHPLSLIDLIVLSPLVFIFLTHNLYDANTVILRILRFTTICNMFHFYRNSRVVFLITTMSQKIWYELLVILIISLQCMLITGVIFYAIEHGHNPKVGNILDGIWWSVVTLTTIGYGDIVPYTFLGRCLGMLLAIIGVGLVALPTGILASGFIHALQVDKRNTDIAHEFENKKYLEQNEQKKKEKTSSPKKNKKSPSVVSTRLFKTRK